MAKFGPPEPFDFSQPVEEPIWRQKFSCFRVPSKLNRKGREVHVNSLLYSIGFFRDFFVIPAGTKDMLHPEYEFALMIQKFDEHFVSKRNVIHDCTCFHKRSQRAGETVKAFVRWLFELAQHCSFGKGKDGQNRDQIVIRIMD